MELDLTRVQALCFDVDGTLSDTDDIMVNRVSRLLRPVRALFPRFNSQVAARRFVMFIESPGNFIIGIPDRFGFDDHLASARNKLMKRLPTRQKSFQIIPGVQEMMTELHGRYPMAVVSARGQKFTMMFLEQFNILQDFECVVTARTAPRTKPFADPILWAAGQMEVEPESCLMIGDTTVDIRAAKAAGAQSIGVLCGFGERKELERAGADMIVDTTSDVLKILVGKR